MKRYVFVVLSMLVATGCAKPEVIVPFTCMHPLVNGGLPFRPDHAHFSGDGTLLIKSDNGLRVELSGAYCIKVNR